MSESLRAALEADPKIDLYRRPARFTADKVVRAGEEELTAGKIFIAAGSLPRIPPVPGLEGTPFWTSTEALSHRVLPRKMVILGGSFIACELGHAYSAFGTEVHLVAPDGLLHRLDDDIRREFEEVFARNQAVHNGAFPRRVSHREGVFRVSSRGPGGEDFDLEADALLVAAGVVPQTRDLGLENTGIELREGGFISVDDRLRTAVPGVYAFGDCVGNYLFRHSVNFEGEYLVRTALGGDDSPIDYWPVPYAIFSWPEAAGVGKTERELAAGPAAYAAGREALRYHSARPSSDR
jgi:dihydrolipoamide dehydrogenase